MKRAELTSVRPSVGDQVHESCGCFNLAEEVGPVQVRQHLQRRRRRDGKAIAVAKITDYSYAERSAG